MDPWSRKRTQEPMALLNVRKGTDVLRCQARRELSQTPEQNGHSCLQTGWSCSSGSSQPTGTMSWENYCTEGSLCNLEQAGPLLSEDGAKKLPGPPFLCRTRGLVRVKVEKKAQRQGDSTGKNYQ